MGLKRVHIRLDLLTSFDLSLSKLTALWLVAAMATQFAVAATNGSPLSSYEAIWTRY